MPPHYLQGISSLCVNASCEARERDDSVCIRRLHLLHIHITYTHDGGWLHMHSNTCMFVKKFLTESGSFSLNSMHVCVCVWCVCI